MCQLTYLVKISNFDNLCKILGAQIPLSLLTLYIKKGDDI